MLARLGERAKARKEMIRDLDEQVRINKLVEERSKSSNKREFERFQREAEEESITEQLKVLRKQREKDINFGHNPLDTPNITSHTEWNVLKERNQFTNNKNMFMGQGNVLKNNKKLLRNNRSLLR